VNPLLSPSRQEHLERSISLSELPHTYQPPTKQPTIKTGQSFFSPGTVGLDARQQTEVTESAEEVEPAERAQEKAAEDAGQEGTTFVFRPKPESRS
jgi:hypothetical protein